MKNSSNSGSAPDRMAGQRHLGIEHTAPGTDLAEGLPEKMNDLKTLLLEPDADILADLLDDATDVCVDSDQARKFLPKLYALIENQVPEAMYLASCIMKKREKSETFDQRRYWLLHQAARLNHAKSIYLLGVYHELGDGVMKSWCIYSAYYEKAATLGHSRAKLWFGLDLFRGINRIPQDKERGLDYLRQAVAENAEGAAEILDRVLAGEFD